MNDSEQAFEQGARAALRAREQQVDAATLARLGTLRARALAAAPPRWPGLHMPWLAGAALVAVLGVTALLGTQLDQYRGSSADSEQAADDPELYEDLDFYVWLSESDMGSRG